MKTLYCVTHFPKQERGASRGGERGWWGEAKGRGRGREERRSRVVGGSGSRWMAEETGGKRLSNVVGRSGEKWNIVLWGFNKYNGAVEEWVWIHE